MAGFSPGMLFQAGKMSFAIVQWGMENLFVCVVCDGVSVLINPLPISHDMFISLLPGCIVNTKPQPELLHVCV